MSELKLNVSGQHPAFSFQLS